MDSAGGKGRGNGHGGDPSGESRRHAPGEESFEDLFGKDVRRIPRGRHAEVPRRRPRAPGAGSPKPEPGPAPLVVRGSGPSRWGFAPGESPETARTLRRRPPRVDREVDLHQQTRREARQTVCATLAEALEAGEEVVRIVHGRGRHSGLEGSVLRRELPDWLAEPPHGRSVRAFATERHGGATLVLLRRRR